MALIALDDLITSQFGVATEPRISAPGLTIGTAAVQLFGNDPRRLAWIVVNLSLNDAFIAPDLQVSSSRGLKAAAGGGSVSMIFREDFHLTGQAEFAVASAAASSILIIEILARRSPSLPAS